MRIGFIGTGIMGRPMALNLIKAGHDLLVYGRRYDTLEALLVAGALGKGTPAEVAAGADITITMLPDTRAVEDVILGERGAIKGAKPGSVMVDMSTISPNATIKVAEKLSAQGIEMLDAPVSGGEMEARDGTLSIMVGGKPEVYERVLPLFEALGKNIMHVGRNGAGQVAKACHQIVFSLTLEGVAEAFLLARRNGVDPAKVREALLGGYANSSILEVHGQRMLQGDFKPGFKLRLHDKDMRIVLDNAREQGLALPGTACVAQRIHKLIEAGDGELDSTAVLRAIEREDANEGNG
jgi:2-hydroxy-3-oxopropionate reductase